MRIRTTRTAYACFAFLPMIILLAAIGISDNVSASGEPARDAQHAFHESNQLTAFLSLDKFHLRGIDGPYHTSGNRILGVDNQPYLFHGIARDDLEYLCPGDGHYTQQELGYIGIGQNSAQSTYWGSNTVRLPLSESFWLHGSQGQNCSALQYKANLRRIVDILTTLNLNVMIDLQWTDAGGQAPGAGDAFSMPDKDSVTFWQQVATLYKGYRNILFEVFNESHLAGGNWPCWRNGCSVIGDFSGSTGHDHRRYTYQGVGLQTLLDTIRHTGANNLVVAAGVDWGFNLSQLPTYHLNGNNVVYDTHPYPYGSKQPAYWDSAFGTISAVYPVISAESGEYDCKSTFINRLFSYFDAHDIGWMSWAWLPPYGDACHYPRLVSDLTGKPIAGMGQAVYQHLHLYLALLVDEEIPAKIKVK